MNFADALHQELQKYGQPVTIKRRTGTQQLVTVAIETMAVVRAKAPVDMPSATAQAGFTVIVSPRDVYRALSKGLRRKDTINFDGRDRTIDGVDEFTVGGQVARIELDVVG